MPELVWITCTQNRVILCTRAHNIICVCFLLMCCKLAGIMCTLVAHAWNGSYNHLPALAGHPCRACARRAGDALGNKRLQKSGHKRVRTTGQVIVMSRYEGKGEGVLSCKGNKTSGMSWRRRNILPASWAVVRLHVPVFLIKASYWNLNMWTLGQGFRCPCHSSTALLQPWPVLKGAPGRVSKRGQVGAVGADGCGGHRWV